jgi:hypothetical protein
VLLGAAARQYDRFDPNTAWRVFHAGAVRFGNAYPLTADGEPTLPVPLAWHAAKGAESAIYNLAVRPAPAGIQPEQLRERFITRDGRAVRPRVDHRQMTAVDRESFGTAREGALFGVSKLRRGQAYWCRIRFAGDLDDDVVQRVIDALTDAQLRVGRARHTEHGAISLTPADDQTSGAIDGLLAHGRPSGPDGVAVHLLADVAPAAGDGPPLPRNVPPSMFGLPAHWQFWPERSFLRSDRWSPFNGKRQLHDHERQVWQQGSILTFTVGSDANADVEAAVAEARDQTRGGVGYFRAEGLGDVLVAPWFMDQHELHISDADPLAGPERATPTAPADALAGWAMARAKARQMPLIAGRLADDHLPRLEHLYEHAWAEARRQGEPPYSQAPASAQWPELGAHVARYAADGGESVSLEDVRAEIGITGDDNGFCRERGRRRVWVSFEMPRTGERFLDVLGLMTAPDTLDAYLRDAGLGATGKARVQLARDALRALAHRAPRRLAQLAIDAEHGD